MKIKYISPTGPAEEPRRALSILCTVILYLKNYQSQSVIFWISGKTLGGSSAINFLQFHLPSKSDIDGSPIYIFMVLLLKYNSQRLKSLGTPTGTGMFLRSITTNFVVLFLPKN